MLGQNVDSPATGQFAESEGIPWVGYDSDAQKFAPKSWLTASVYNWGPYYLQPRQGGDGRHVEAGFYYGSIKDGFTGLAPYGPGVSRGDEGRDRDEEEGDRERLVLRVHRPAVRPERQAARAEGANEADACTQLYSMNWLVKGVIGSPKG